VLQIQNPKTIDVNKGFIDLGLDSLMALEFKNRLQRVFGNELKLDPQVLFDYPNTKKLGSYIFSLYDNTSRLSNEKTQDVSDILDDLSVYLSEETYG